MEDNLDGLEILERQSIPEPVDAEVVIEEEELTSAEQLEAIQDLIRNCAVLLEFIANPEYCKELIKRDRRLADMQAERLFLAADELNDIIEELTDDTDDEEDDE